MSRFDPKIRVVIEGAEFADYFWPAVEQYVECTHEYWRSNGQFVPNVTLRLASGGYIGGGLYHSQNLEGALATLPGARIVCPSLLMMLPDCFVQVYAPVVLRCLLNRKHCIIP